RLPPTRQSADCDTHLNTRVCLHKEQAESLREIRLAEQGVAGRVWAAGSWGYVGEPPWRAQERERSRTNQWRVCDRSDAEQCAGCLGPVRRLWRRPPQTDGPCAALRSHAERHESG